MATTGRGIQYPTTANQVTPLANVFASLATTADTAIGNVENNVAAGSNHYTGTDAQRQAFSGANLHEGITWYATDTDLMWVRRNTTWKLMGGRPIAVRVEKNIAQNTNTSATMITWNSSGAVTDTDNFYSTGSNTRITLPFTGIYHVGFTIKSNGTAGISAGFAVNGTYNTALESASAGASGAGSSVTVSDIANFTAGTYLQVRHTSSSSGTAFNVGASRIWAIFMGQL